MKPNNVLINISRQWIETQVSEHLVTIGVHMN